MIVLPLQRLDLARFQADVAAAYSSLAQAFWCIGRNDKGEPCFPDDDAEVRVRIRAAAGRCGAAVAAAVKREKRRRVIDALIQARTAGLDITSAVAQGVAQRLLGRGLDSRATAAVFATPGRTAACKSHVTADDLATWEATLTDVLAQLTCELQAVQLAAAASWQSSAERTTILEDWRAQRQGRRFEPYPAA